MQSRKVSTSVSLEVSQAERLALLVARTRVPRSVIIRDALERELRRIEKDEARKVGGPPQGGEGREASAAQSL